MIYLMECKTYFKDGDVLKDGPISNIEAVEVFKCPIIKRHVRVVTADYIAPELMHIIHCIKNPDDSREKILIDYEPSEHGTVMVVTKIPKDKESSVEKEVTKITQINDRETFFWVENPIVW